MAHISEESNRLVITHLEASDVRALEEHARDFSGVCLLKLPAAESNEQASRLENVGEIVANVAGVLGQNATLITVGETVDLVAVQAAMPPAAADMQYQSWVAIKREPEIKNGDASLPRSHFGALIHTRYESPLKHAKTRVAYAFCPACDKTTKDYGGKKHIYHHYGTLLSDVWRDISGNPAADDISAIVDRFADFFGIDIYKELRVIDCASLFKGRSVVKPVISLNEKVNALPKELSNTLIQGDSLEALKKIPDNSIDFAFADPPYNLSKNYAGYTDDLAVTEYFDWCDEWLTELARVLKPGRTCAILNIPLYTIRHFVHLEKILNFQNWIVWDALSFPVRLLMPAHYSIIFFSKGAARPLPGLQQSGAERLEFQNYLQPLASDYCLRSRCVEARRREARRDREPISDLWADIHRLKHNTRRVDHPCQLPPQLMNRLIALLTNPGEVVLDCFNGAGTTTLTAHQLGRKYIGIEKEETYHDLALSRHEEVARGLDPFRKVARVLNAKNSPVKRLQKQKYEIPKKTLQLEVKRIAAELGRLPNRDEVAALAKFPIEYYDNYFLSWGEVCAAARNTGMSENRIPGTPQEQQLALFGTEKGV